MVDDQDDIFELTEDMASIPPPPPEKGTADDDVSAPSADDGEGETTRPVTPPPRRSSVPPPGASSPFSLLAEPKDPEPREDLEEKLLSNPPPRPSYIPEKKEVPVVAVPIRKVGDNLDSDEMVLDLGQEMIVDKAFESEGAEPKEDVKKSHTPPPPPPDESDKETEDLGTPEKVFDALPADDKSKAEDEDPGVEIDVETEAEELESDEEIELDEAEVMFEGGVDVPPVPEEANLKAATAGKRPKIRRRRKRQKEWWAEIFDDDYLSLLPPAAARDTRRELDLIEKSLSVAKGSLLLDLGCGNGRHAVGMARRGYRIVGVDLSLPMLARAGELAQEADQKINFIHGDMRDLGFDRTFDGVYCMGTSLGYFDDSTNFKVFEGVARALKPGAPFLLEVANRDHVVLKQPNLTWFEGNGSVCMEETTFNYINSRLYVVRQLIMGEGGRQVKHELSIRLYSLHELGAMLHNAGFAVAQVAGHQSTPGAFFGVDSALIIILASRRR